MHTQIHTQYRQLCFVPQETLVIHSTWVWISRLLWTYFLHIKNIMNLRSFLLFLSFFLPFPSHSIPFHEAKSSNQWSSMFWLAYFTQEILDNKSWLKCQNSFKYLPLLMITTAALKICCPWYHLHSHRNINLQVSKKVFNSGLWGLWRNTQLFCLMLPDSIIGLTWWNKLFFFHEAYLVPHY